MSSWWWCLKHSRVEEDAGCALTDRLGPYGSAQEAGRALSSVRRRTEDQDALDAEDDDWGSPPVKR